MAKSKPRYEMIDGKLRLGLETYSIRDTLLNQIVRRNDHNRYDVERRVERLNMLADTSRQGRATTLINFLGQGKEMKKISTFNIGWDRRNGGPKSILCLSPSNTDKGEVINISGIVSDVLGWKCEEDISVIASNPSSLIAKLSYMLYGKDNRIKHVRL